MSLKVGSVLSGIKWRYRLIDRLGDHTVFSSVFKAEILPGSQSKVPTKFAVIKTTDPQVCSKKNSLFREYKYHKASSINACPSIRKMYDTINDPNDWTAEKPFCLALEWMDTTLEDVPAVIPLRSTALAKAVVEASLHAFVAADQEGLVYTDLKPSNVLLSGVDGPSPQAKIGDLGVMGPEGLNESWLQPEAFRAPEVWVSVSCYHKSDVWSLAALMLNWIDNGIVGNHDNNGSLPPMIWCLAKLMRLFATENNPIVPPSSTASKDLQLSFEYAKKLVSAARPDNPKQYILDTPGFDEWAAAAEAADLIPKVVLDMIRFLAILDPANRPTAAQALVSNEFKALEAAAALESKG
ncbi:hypothetical protein LOZ53_006453 [Ophidiomyces ophidiicola]|nr:hypothetical protein LOZ55_003851 [Ophidiomyces ophidiicola]KAI1980078.1 hypothetical protein LOZ54_005915 [Ophidiomyces ophidiicola]KAI1981472.1 hypothetical protein LOZ53_006453 [Ophidiomyces ophidiicola]KAI1998423.1 hypothetical protein LOZ51_002154 [Ophidiomyces ophidiicola]